MDELKPCPFCGSEAELYSHSEDDDVIECSMCAVSMSGISVSCVVAKWNTRSEE